MQTKNCHSVHSSPTKRTMTANASPSWEVPSEVFPRNFFTDTCFPFFQDKWSVIKCLLLDIKAIGASSRSSLKLSNIDSDKNGCPKRLLNSIDLLLFWQGLTAQMLVHIVLCKSHSNVLLMSLFHFQPLSQQPG